MPTEYTSEKIMKVEFYNLSVYIVATSDQRNCVAAIGYTTAESHKVRINMMKG
jgi:hypothetical protein